MNWVFVSLKSLYVEFITLNEIVFGDRVDESVIWVHKGEAQSERSGARIRKERNNRALSFFVWREKVMWSHSKMVVTYKKRKEPYQEMNRPALWSWTSWPPKLWKNKILLFNPPSLLYFVMLVQKD